MVGLLHESERQMIAMLRARLNRVQRGEAWGPDQPGPYNATERMQEIIRIKNRISELERNLA
jgi:hypothetical protein